MYAFWEASEFAFQRHSMYRALRAASVSEIERLSARIHRLEEERGYSRPGWRVAVRRAKVQRVSPASSVTARSRWMIHLRAWLSHPLIDLGKAA